MMSVGEVGSCNDEEDGEVVITYLDNGVEKTTKVKAYSDCLLDKLGSQEIIYALGVSPTTKIEVVDLILSPITGTVSLVSGAVSQIVLLFTSSELGANDLMGFVGMYAVTDTFASQGFITFVSFMALISVSIGIANLLPIPMLDGGRLTFLGYEAITKKTVKKEVENALMNISAILLIGLMIYILFNDISRFFVGG